MFKTELKKDADANTRRRPAVATSRPLMVFVTRAGSTVVNRTTNPGRKMFSQFAKIPTLNM